ncbi:hypothetical protein P2G88_07855 [Aliiglaciecola sp. CAU 1673]|uniref:efflux RND transporter periplasmic adaptor subunit n=1 Tax=Aliiglaciecola sp. CAU 1673 TaxID=3032595 RepID=UPI0023DB7D67|nr:hypothetical protein [Aliiglaciecola sp. CAU 1673]MDF2178165.1 hypothetical protein [Aliiglaciecola sp. CAU 1673]
MKLDWQKRRWLLILPLAGLVILIALAKLRPGPGLREDSNPPPLVSVVKVQQHNLRPYVLGFGRAQPKEVWQALAEVSGRVIYRHPELEQGKTLTQGTLLLKVDPVDYELKLAQAKSDLQSAEAELARLALNKDKLSLSVKLERQRLDILNKELKRKQGLLGKGSVSQSSVDAEQSNVWAQEQKLLDIENSLKQHPAEMEVARAKVKVAEARLDEAKRKLEKTEIRLPFDARIANISAELEQVVSERESLLSAHRLGAMQVPVQVSLNDMRHFARYLAGPLPEDGAYPDIQRWELEAEVSLSVGNQRFVWPGKLISVGESIDPKGNTVTLLVEVPADNEPFDPKKRPPLINDMYVQVRVLGQPQSLLAVPSEALHGDRLYLLDDQHNLQIRSVTSAFESQGLTVIQQGIEAGEWVVLSDIMPAVPGRSLRPAPVDNAQSDKRAGGKP